MPYYAAPSKEKSHVPQGGRLVEFEEVGFAFNREVQDLLRSMGGFTGYVNSDSGILSKMAWGGVEDLSTVERAGGVAISVGGTDIIADTNDVASIREAYVRGLFPEDRLNEAATRLLTDMFALGLFDNPYVDPEQADAVVANADFEAQALEAHRRSIVLLKNGPRVDAAEGPLLPLTAAKLAGSKVYVELFQQDLLVAELDAFRDLVAQQHPELTFTTDYRDADAAILIVKPFTGAYFEFTGLNDLTIDEHSHVNLAKIRAIREQVGTVAVALNLVMAWLPGGTIEPLADGLIAGFDTRAEVLFDTLVGGNSPPTGSLPLTLPINQAALAVDENGRCASPNDVPGFDKEKYMDGRPYVYVDAAGNRYVSGFGLRYDA